jgi:transposase
LSRSRNGEAISEARRTESELASLHALVKEAESHGDLDTWRRAVGIQRYLAGKRVEVIREELGVARSTVNTWLRWFEILGTDGLRSRKAPGPSRKLDSVQRAELTRLVEAGPIAAGFTSGMWTGPMVGQLIRERFGINYHNHTIPRILHELGFSVQRPRKRLARADHEQQEVWIKERLPAIKKKPRPAAG